MDYIVGLAVDFVDDEGSYVRCLDEDSAVLPHLTFFLSLLSVEGCKLLVLDDAFAVSYAGWLCCTYSDFMWICFRISPKMHSRRFSRYWS